MLAVVQTEFRYRGRNISGAEIESVRQLIADHPGLSRRRLSAKLCQSWNWVQANGQLRDMVARSLMLQLHRAGLIVLPAKRKSVPNNAARHRAPLLEPPCGGRAAGMWFGRVGAVGDSASAPHSGGSTLWPVAPNLSLSGVSSAGRGACQISGLWPGPADRLPGVVVGASTPGSARPFHRLVCPAAPSADPPAGLQHALFNPALGAGSGTWPAICWAGWRAGSRTIGSGFTSIRFICWRPSSNRPAFAALVIARPTGFAWA